MIRCGRIHLGPVAEGSNVCNGCGKTMTPEERYAYWRVRLQVRCIIGATHEYVVEYLKKRAT